MIPFIRNLIRRGVVSRKTEDLGQFSIAQLKWGSDKVGNVEVLQPYGLSSYAPVGSLGLIFNVMGHEENRAAIINDPKKRFKNLKEGEVALGNFLTKSVIKFLESGDIEITGKANQNITIIGDSNLTVGGNTTITTTGNITINTTGNNSIITNGDTSITTTGNTTIDTTGDTSVSSDGDLSATVGGSLTADITGNTSITSPLVAITGALQVSGEITAFYSLANEISFTDIKTTYNIHEHISSTPGSNTSVPDHLLS